MPLSALPEILTLDVGQTFLFPDPPLSETYARMAARHGMPAMPSGTEQVWTDAWEYTKGRRDGLIYGTTHDEGLDFWIEVNYHMFRDHGLSREEQRPFVHDLYHSYGKAGLWRVAPGLDRLLAVCADLGVPVALVSNWDLRLRGLLEELDLLDRFQEIVISAEVGIEKPDPRIFQHALGRLGGTPERAVHVGDTWPDDILGARACGMKAVWLAPDSHPLPEPLPGVLRLPDLGTLAESLCQSFCAAS